MAKRRPSGDGMVRKRDDSRMTLGQWLDRWMEDYAANTLRSYEQYIRCYIKPYLARWSPASPHRTSKSCIPG